MRENDFLSYCNNTGDGVYIQVQYNLISASWHN